jgi:hypothetical protein
MDNLSEYEKRNRDIRNSGFKLRTLHNAVPIHLLFDEKNGKQYPPQMLDAVLGTRAFLRFNADPGADYWLLQEELPAGPKSGLISVPAPVHAIEWPNDKNENRTVMYGDCDEAGTWLTWSGDEGEYVEAFQNAFIKILRGEKNRVTIEKGFEVEGKPFTNITVFLTYDVFERPYNIYNEGEAEKPLKFWFDDVEITETGFKARVTYFDHGCPIWGFSRIYDEPQIPFDVGGEG